MPLPNFELKYSDGRPYSLNDYNNYVILIVNTASQCGLNGQLRELETLYQTYRQDDFVVLAFPSDQFHQEPLANQEMQSQCQRDFGVSFPINERVQINGQETVPIYQWLKQERSGFLNGSIKWNFTKFLLNRQGQVVKRYPPTFSPQQIAKDIEDLL
ncbi:glutathione peroxidase [Ignavigranum ruoffiae]|uniref:glutathione peroxidase n=1 Tax=Ignavigranum ruoffiae TaxID=89093 RepID=UPI0020563F5F|nr:glutathione peroxidase [Ignavigranum ruoffiae]UPQ86156.1 glutathione peroxidase [Ignavigranum ruoffiae]